MMICRISITLVVLLLFFMGNGAYTSTPRWSTHTGNGDNLQGTDNTGNKFHRVLLAEMSPLAGTSASRIPPGAPILRRKRKPPPSAVLQPGIFNSMPLTSPPSYAPSLLLPASPPLSPALPMLPPPPSPRSPRKPMKPPKVPALPKSPPPPKPPAPPRPPSPPKPPTLPKPPTSPKPPSPSKAPSPPPPRKSPPPTKASPPSPFPHPPPPPPSPPSPNPQPYSYLPLLEPAAILDAHNKYRMWSGVPNLTWSDELATSAQSWSDNCVFEHSYGQYGENLVLGTFRTLAAILYGMSLWTNEMCLYNFDTPGFNTTTGHYTQVVWKSTRMVGCGYRPCSAVSGYTRTCNSCGVLTCQYYPPGNYLSVTLFRLNVLKPNISWCPGTT
ncbi:hypothetical protein Vretimale_350 [Volvox reticuliferus]|uniref:SCP domain-containing protein n=1 Tax=Volvox reticuliferus TaxID=1737510 RepID=A0A8J4D2Z3_9CHLO|nr:hypothetical protein Vretifemale_8165 [Volvox reticuliferus]GIL94008.1 hypothetical protein Vretimale_350 [Volvox reticuliferus]